MEDSLSLLVSPSYEKLQGDLKVAYSRRINVQHRLVYEVIESEHTIKIIRMCRIMGSKGRLARRATLRDRISVFSGF